MKTFTLAVIFGVMVAISSCNGAGLLLTCPCEHGIFEYPFDCANYLLCEGGDLKIQNCPFQQYFDIKSQQCVPMAQVECNEKCFP